MLKVMMLAILTCGCTRTVYVKHDAFSLKAVRMERNGVSGVWMPDAFFRSIKANAECIEMQINDIEDEAE